jgi:hypothetical protein
MRAKLVFFALVVGEVAKTAEKPPDHRDEGVPLPSSHEGLERITVLEGVERLAQPGMM